MSPQNRIILKALMHGKILTPYSILKIGGGLRASERIREIERHFRVTKTRFAIHRKRVKVSNGTWVMSYTATMAL